MGSNTIHGFLYKPSLGATGQAEKDLFDGGLNRVDTRLGTVHYVGDTGISGYSTFATAVATLNADGSDCTLVVPVGAHAVSANLTVNDNINLVVLQGADIQIANAITLTISGPYEAGNYSVFSCTGTGKVTWNSPTQPNVRWWGATGGGVTEDSAAFTAAQTAVKDGTRRQPIIVPTGNYVINEVPIYSSVGFKAVGQVTYTAPDENASVFILAENWVDGGNTSPYHIMFDGGKIDASSCTFDIDVIYSTYQINRAVIKVAAVGKTTASQRFLRMVDSVNSAFYNNIITECAIRNFTSPDGVIYLANDPAALGQASNANHIYGNYFAGFRVAIHMVSGTFNQIHDNQFTQSAATTSPVVITTGQANGGFDWVIRFDNANGNVVGPNYIEGGDTNYGQVFAPNSAVEQAGAIVIGHGNCYRPEQICSYNTVYKYTAVYDSDTTCKIEGVDVANVFPLGTKVWFFNTATGWFSSLTSIDATFDGVDTNITITEAKFDADLEFITGGYLAWDLTRRRSRTIMIGGHQSYLPKLGTERFTVGLNGDGTEISQIKAGTSTINPASINATTALDIAITVTGAVAESPAYVNPPATLDAGIVIERVWVTADTINIRLYNRTGAPINPGSADWSYMVFGL